ncbi:SUN domain-containing protein [Fusarium sp. Ph1]|nr:SUN domain-containing protein [Fusarium sp. Ph1]
MTPSLGSTVLRLLAISSAWTPPTQAQAQSQESNRADSSTSTTVSSCDARTINYITHTLPQSCLTSSWSSATPSAANATADAPSNVTSSDAPQSSSADAESQSSTPAATAEGEQDAAGEEPAKPFMSFEDWKEMMLRQTGQDPQDLRSRNNQPRRADDRIPPDMGHAGLGEEDEISLNFDSYLDNAGEQKDRPSGGDVEIPGRDGAGQVVMYDKSKDAGKTCKERFSYSSFDAGATVLKSSPGAKNAKAILVENKDSYMLLECSAPRKFVIVELSDDVLIDTVVIANFEFFSSMVRLFRVSVSDRYPVKPDKWKELGSFEARNSRDIQPFLVENPQIWAKYVRIEFLTQYGNEYYCPVSLIRIHGSRMLDSWKEDTESGRDDGSHEEHEEPQQLPSPEDESAKPQETEKPQESIVPTSTEKMPYCEVDDPTMLFLAPLVCPASFNATTGRVPSQPDTSSIEGISASSQNVSTEDRERSGASTPHVRRAEYPATEDATSSSSSSTTSPSATPAISPTSPSSISSSSASTGSNSTAPATSAKTASTSSTSTSSSASTSIAKSSPANTVIPKNRTTATTSNSPASPTVQEGFFKAISKRLHQVESNLTLSLKYVEDQARHMSDTLHRTEQKQISKATLFLNNLNQTVLAELRSVREQYDQIWQSTVIALESQREQSNREIVALSTRLNLLADEVVFQKRMAIVQAVLLLSCLLLVIFSRGVSLPYLAPFMDQASLASYDASASSPGRVRALYGNSYDTDGEDPSLLTPRSRRDYIPLSSSAGDVSSADLRRRTSFVNDSRLECEQLSPPPTPGPVDGYTSSTDAPLSSHEAQPAVLRRSPAMHSNNSRKPLPALPENPSSP